MDTRFKTSDIDEIGPTDGLIAYYNMDNLDGTTLLDNSGNGNNATNNGATLVAGINGNALSFNGTGNYAYVPYTAALAPTSQITVSAWAYKTGWNDGLTRKIISKTEAGGYNIGIFNTTINFYVCRNNVYATPGITNALTDGWHLLTGTYDGRYAKMYIDGILINTNDAGGNYPIQYTYSNALFIGAEAQGVGPPPAGDYWNGLIDEVRIYNKALSSAEISQLYKLNAKHTQLFTDNYESSLNYSNTISLTTNIEGNNVKNDITGENLGVLSNTTLIDDYFNFNGTDSYINIGDNARLNTGGTISMWYYARNAGENGYGRLIDKSTDLNSTNGYFIYFSTTKITIGMNGVDSIIQTSFTSLNTWHHIVAVIASTKKEIWIDGIKVASNTNTTLPPDVAGNVYIGNRADVTDRTFDGYIKNVRIYTRDLTSEEIRYLYNEGK